MTLDELNTLLPKVQHWFAEGDGIECAYSVDGVEHYQRITYVELDNIRPQLGIAVQHIALQAQRAYQQRSLSEQLLCAQVKQSTAPVMVPSLNRGVRGLLQVAHITWIRSNEFVYLGAFNYTLRNTLRSLNGNNKRVSPFVDEAVYGELHVPLDWMDTQYPGWRDRYAAAEALDCPFGERASFVCIKPVVSAPAAAPLPDTLTSL